MSNFPKFSPSKKLSFFFKFLVSFGFVGWLIAEVDWEKVWKNIINIKKEYLALYVGLLLLGILISSKKWQLLARYKGFQHSFVSYVHIYVTGMFINNFFPSVIGGDAFRLYWLGKSSGRYATALSTVVFDRLTGLWSSVLLTLVFSLVYFQTLVSLPVFWMFEGIFLVVVAGGVLWVTLPSFVWTRLVYGWFPVKLKGFLEEVQEYRRSSRVVQVVGLAILFNMVGVGLANFVLFQSFGYSLPFFPYLAVIFLVSIISSIPVSVNNIGIKEWAYYTFFSFLGIAPEVAVTVAIVGRFMQMIISFFALPTYLQTKVNER